MLSSKPNYKITTTLSFLFAEVIVVNEAEGEVPVCGGRSSSTVLQCVPHVGWAKITSANKNTFEYFWCQKYCPPGEGSDKQSDH